MEYPIHIVPDDMELANQQNNMAFYNQYVLNNMAPHNQHTPGNMGFLNQHVPNNMVPHNHHIPNSMAFHGQHNPNNVAPPHQHVLNNMMLPLQYVPNNMAVPNQHVPNQTRRPRLYGASPTSIRQHLLNMSSRHANRNRNPDKPRSSFFRFPAEVRNEIYKLLLEPTEFQPGMDYHERWKPNAVQILHYGHTPKRVMAKASKDNWRKLRLQDRYAGVLPFKSYSPWALAKVSKRMNEEVAPMLATIKIEDIHFSFYNCTMEDLYRWAHIMGPERLGKVRKWSIEGFGTCYGSQLGDVNLDVRHSCDEQTRSQCSICPFQDRGLCYRDVIVDLNKFKASRSVDPSTWWKMFLSRKMGQTIRGGLDSRWHCPFCERFLFDQHDFWQQKFPAHLFAGPEISFFRPFVLPPSPHSSAAARHPDMREDDSDGMERFVGENDPIGYAALDHPMDRVVWEFFFGTAKMILMEQLPVDAKEIHIRKTRGELL